VAKKIQSFADKTKKKADQSAYKVVKVIFSFKSPNRGTWRFGQKIVKVPFEVNEEQFLQEQIDQAIARQSSN
jgi:hypothetical protein